MSTDKMHRDDAVMATITNGGVVEGFVDTTAFGPTDSITFEVTDAFAAAKGLTAFYIGGDDLTSAEVFSFSQAGSAGPQSVTLPFADPSCVIFFSSAGVQVINTIAAGGAFMIGGVVKNGDGSFSQAVSSTRALDAITDADNATYSRSGQCCAFISPTAPLTSCAARGSVTAISGTTLTLTWAEADANARLIFGVALKGPQFAVRTFTSQNNTDPFAVNAGFEVRGGMVLGCSVAESADDTPDAHDRLTIGFFDSVINQQSQTTANNDAVGTAISSAGTSLDSVFSSVSLDAVPVVDFDMAVTSISSPNVTFTPTVAAATATDFIWGLFIGDAAPVVAATPKGGNPFLSVWSELMQ